MLSVQRQTMGLKRSSLAQAVQLSNCRAPQLLRLCDMPARAALPTRALLIGIVSRWALSWAAAQVSGLGPIAALKQHLADPINTTIFSKAAVIPTQAIAPACAIPSSVMFQVRGIPYCL